MVAALAVATVLTDVLRWLLVSDCIGDFIALHIHVENLKIWILQVEKSIDTVVEAHDVSPVGLMSQSTSTKGILHEHFCLYSQYSTLDSGPYWYTIKK